MFGVEETLDVWKRNRELAELARRPTPMRTGGLEGLQHEWDAGTGDYSRSWIAFLDRTDDGVLDTTVVEFDPGLHVHGVSPAVTHYDHLPPNARSRHLEAYLEAIASGYKPRSVTHALPPSSE